MGYQYRELKRLPPVCEGCEEKPAVTSATTLDVVLSVFL